MHRAIFCLVVIFLLISLVHNKPAPKRRCGCGHIHCKGCRLSKPIEAIYATEEAPTQRGLYELQQTTRSRGFIPSSNQPNHTANLWKCDLSHPKVVGSGQYDTIFASDYPTPIRGSSVNLTVQDVSNMHLVSRFGQDLD